MSPPNSIAAVVEGDGEVVALPVLLRRLIPGCRVPTPVRRPRTKLVRSGLPVEEELQKYAIIASRNITANDTDALVLLLIDADDDCSATLGPSMKTIIAAALPGFRVETVCAVREFEAWLVAAGSAGDAPANTETVRDSKAILKAHLGRYSPTADQARLVANMDLEQARTAPSFRKLLRALGLEE